MTEHKFDNVILPSEARKKPHLVFLGLPPNWEALPPLASSLQHFETSLFLISLRRYPNALLSCVAAIEGALRAAFKIPEDSEEKLINLLDKAKGRFPPHVGYRAQDIKRMRIARNRITHYGYSPEDDEESAEIMLSIAIKFLHQCYSSFFNFNLLSKIGDGGNYADSVAWLLAMTIAAWKTRGQEKSPTIARSHFSAIGHLVRWQTQHWGMSEAQMTTLSRAAEIGIEFDAVSKESNRHFHSLDIPWKADCPICGGFETMLCELDGGESFDRADFEATQIICSNCDLYVPKEARGVAKFIADSELKRRKADICKEYGVEAPNS